jgi:uncharacterized repeat protein (TIGR03803 family)
VYGTTLDGGANHGGTVFSLNSATGEEQVVYSFCGQQSCADGINPYAGLTSVNDTLYGTTKSGGANYAGTVFSIKP